MGKERLADFIARMIEKYGVGIEDDNEVKSEG